MKILCGKYGARDEEKEHDFKLEGLLYVLFDGRVFNMETQRITEAEFDEVFIQEEHGGGTEPLHSMRAELVEKKDGAYWYYGDFYTDLCENDLQLLYGLKDYYTNDVIWNLYKEWHAQYLEGRPMIGTMDYMRYISTDIETISNYDLGF